MLTDGSGYVVHEGCDHIFFVGFFGSGKSTLARNLGQLFHRGYVDTDHLAERLAKKNVNDIFNEDGEQAFRRMELRALRGLKARKSLLVSCGGGIVEAKGSDELMHEMGTVVFLDGSLEDSLRQIRHLRRRPDLDLCGDVGALFERRRPLYERMADYTIDIHSRSFEQVAADAGQLLWEEGLL